LEGCRLSAGRVFLIGQPEASFFEAVRISFNTTPVILSGAFPREDLILYHFFYKYLKNGILIPLYSLKSLIKTG